MQEEQGTSGPPSNLEGQAPEVRNKGLLAKTQEFFLKRKTSTVMGVAAGINTLWGGIEIAS